MNTNSVLTPPNTHFGIGPGIFTFTTNQPHFAYSLTSADKTLLPLNFMESIQSNTSFVDAMNTMWCNICRQDVPGVVPAEEGKYYCPRCGNTLRGDESISSMADSPHANSQQACASAALGGGIVVDPPKTYDSWELDEQLNHIERVLQISDYVQRNRRSAYKQEVARFDPPHDGLPAMHRATRKRNKSPETTRTDDGTLKQIVSFLTWTALSLGLMAFVCGGVLLGYSVFSGREDLWTFGMPIALSGQIGILLGLVLQLDRLWHDNRQTVDKLDNVDDQLKDLRTTTSLLGTSNSTPGGSFYSHMAGGAGPQMLLNDLKSQLDLLALKISQED